EEPRSRVELSFRFRDERGVEPRLLQRFGSDFLVVALQEIVEERKRALVIAGFLVERGSETRGRLQALEARRLPLQSRRYLDRFGLLARFFQTDEGVVERFVLERCHLRIACDLLKLRGRLFV